jgi:hypothetical protein
VSLVLVDVRPRRTTRRGTSPAQSTSTPRPSSPRSARSGRRRPPPASRHRPARRASSERRASSRAILCSRLDDGRGLGGTLLGLCATWVTDAARRDRTCAASSGPAVDRSPSSHPQTTFRARPQDRRHDRRGGDPRATRPIRRWCSSTRGVASAGSATRSRSTRSRAGFPARQRALYRAAARRRDGVALRPRLLAAAPVWRRGVVAQQSSCSPAATMSVSTRLVQRVVPS